MGYFVKNGWLTRRLPMLCLRLEPGTIVMGGKSSAILTQSKFEPNIL